VCLRRLCTGFAAIHATQLAATIALLGPTHRSALIAVDAVCTALFAVLGILAATRRIPGWRHNSVAATVAVIAAFAAALRVWLLHASWPGAELVLAAGVAVLVSSRWFWVVVGTSAAAWLGSAVTLAARTGLDREQLAGSIEIGLLVAVAAGIATAVRQARATAAAALVNTHRQLVEQSVRDPLTGVANRKGLQLVAQPLIDNARRQGQAVHCLAVDIDAYREITETTHGHHLADDLLVAVAEALRHATRTTDVVARWAGDEFVVLGPGTGTSPLEMERRVRAHLADAGVPKEVWQGKVSAGSATLVPWDSDDLEGLLHRAEQDMALRRSLRRRVASEITEEAAPADQVPQPEAPER